MHLTFERAKTHSNYFCEVFIDNKVLAEMIREKYYEEKMPAEFKLQFNKVVEMENKFLKDFSKNKCKKYLYLDIEKGQLHSIEVDQVIEFVIAFLT